MQETEAAVKGKKSNQGGLKRRFNEIALIARDPILMTALIFSFIFLIVFVFFMRHSPGVRPFHGRKYTKECTRRSNRPCQIAP